MRASIQVANFTWPGGDPAIGSTLAEIGRAADEGGFDTLWVMDHFFQLEPMLGKAEVAIPLSASLISAASSSSTSPGRPICAGVTPTWSTPRPASAVASAADWAV